MLYNTYIINKLMMQLVAVLLGLILGILLFMGGFIGDNLAAASYKTIDAFFTSGDANKLPFEISFKKIDVNKDLNNIFLRGYTPYIICKDGIYRLFDEDVILKPNEIENYYYEIDGKYTKKYLIKVIEDINIDAIKAKPLYDNADLFLEDLFKNYVFEGPEGANNIKTRINLAQCYLVADKGGIIFEYKDTNTQVR